MEVKPGYKQTEVGAIPVDWQVLPVAALAARTPNAIVGGPFGSDLVAADYVSDGIPVIRGQNMGRRCVEGPYVFVSSHKAEYLSANTARPGDVVFTQRGTIGQVAVVPDSPYGRYIISQSQMKVTLNSDTMDTGYFVHVFGGSLFTEYIRRDTIQTGVPHLNLGILRSFAVPVPPLREQQAIAQALSDVDELIQSLERLIAKKRDLKQATMQQLLTGKTRLPGFSGQWVDTTLGDIGECVIGLTYEPNDVVDHGLLVLRASNVQAGRLAYDDNVYVKGPVPDRLRTRTGDILICVRNGSRALIGKCALIDDSAEGLTFGAFMSVYRTPHWEFVLHAFQAGPVQRQIRENVGATINQITNKDLRGFRLNLPPPSEQKAIAEVLSDMDAEITALEARLAKTRDLKQGMMQELLTGRTRLV